MSATRRQQRKEDERSRHRSKLERQFQEAVHRSASFMSDAKWRKALAVIATSRSNVTSTAWKFLNEERTVVENCVPEVDEILNSHLCDGTFYYVTYRHIEWMDAFTDQPELLFEELSTVGEFETVIELRRLRIYGYRPLA